MELQELGKKKKQEPKYLPIEEPSPSWYSVIFFGWAYSLLKKDSKAPLENDDVTPLPSHEKVVNESLSKEIKRHSLFFSMVKSQWKYFLLNILLGTVSVLFEFSGPVYMQLLIQYLTQDEKPLNTGVILAGSFTFICIVYPIIDTQRNLAAVMMGTRVRNSLYNIIYNKTISSINLPEGLGVNLLQVDVTKVFEFFWYFSYFFNTPLQIGIAIYLVHNQVGNAVWVAIATMFIAMAANFSLSGTCKRLNESIMKIRDERMENSTQLLTGMKIIKAYSWEQHFAEKINEIRTKELSKLKILNTLYAINFLYFWILPSLTTVVVFMYYTLVMGQDISTEKAFVTLTALFMLQLPLIAIPLILARLIQLIVSIKRINEVINAKPWSPVPHAETISLKNCSFAYEEKVILKNISLEIDQGEFIAIIGPVGSGKSSFLLGLMGELTLKSGDLRVNTDIAYAPSLDSWLLNTTLRENILMGREFKEDWYWKVVEACCLQPDISALPAGDNTEIGERGINLSGGQKSRICLARAVYSEKQVYLLDDPLSSVDNNVANHIFLNCFQRLLKNKTRILVTHRHNFLDRVDRIAEFNNGELLNVSESVTGVDIEEDFNDIVKVSETGKENKLIEDEDREVGEVRRDVYFEYFKLSGSYAWVVIAGLSVSLWLVTKMAGDIFFKDWSNNPSETDYYLPIYVVLRVGGSVFLLFRTLTLSVIMSLKISSKAHEKLLESFIRAPINLFYDVIPVGRLLNRLSKDINKIDEDIAFTLGSLLVNVFQALGNVLMGVIFFPYLVVFVPIILVPGRYIANLYMKTSRELTRLESISRSPILNHFKETLAGSKFIRAFGQTDHFIRINQTKIDVNTRINYAVYGCQQWAKLYLGILSGVLLCSLFITAIILRDSISVGIIGLSLTYMMQLPSDLSNLLLNLTNLENQMVSVERVKSYTEISQEQPKVSKADSKYPDWPTTPTIGFHNVFMRYRPTTDLVLKGLTFDVPSGLRVGITGRTGSGKSSLFLSLLRIIEIDSGVITIDGINIALLGLEKLRKSITLIPQDPLVFNGTMKENLDPFSLKDEKTLKKALDDVELKFGLDYEVKNNGQNISIGERQLLSLSRALICNSKIILFDEATAGIDPETDIKIQKIIKEKFTGCTILTIAHRLGTIMDSDLILMLADGRLIEKGSPKDLMAFESNFKALAQKIN